MSFRWIMSVLVVSSGFLFSSLIAQQEPDAVPSTLDAATSNPLIGPKPEPVVKAKPQPGRDAAPNGSNPAVTEVETVIVRFRVADANDVSNMLRSLLDPRELDATRPTVDVRSNTLVLRGPRQDLDRVLKLVQQIDAESGFGQNAKSELSQPAATAARVPQWPVPYTTLPAANVPHAIPPRSHFPAEAKLQQEFATLESQSVEAARKYRKGKETLGPNHPEQQKLREQVQKLVQQAFDVRQEMNNQELKQLKDRLAKVEQSMAKRIQNRSAIIEKRAKGLLEEDRDLDWNETTAAITNYSVTTSSTLIPKTTTGPDGRPFTFYEVYPPVSPAPVGVPAIATTLPPPVAGSVPALVPTPPAAAAPATIYRPTVVDPMPAAPTTNDGLVLPSGASQRRAFVETATALQQLEKEVAELKGRLKPEEMEQNAGYQAAVQRLQAAQRSFEAIRREFEAQKTLLQLDLRAAEADLEVASADNKRLSELLKQNAASQGVVQRSQAALQQAEIRAQRAKVLLELHLEAMRSSPTAGGATDVRSDNSRR